MSVSKRIEHLLPLAVLAFGMLQTTAATDFCNPDICDPGDPHIGCGNNGELSASCPEGSKVEPVTDEIKKIILDEHNKYRSTVATGGLSWLPKASKMTTMTWDDELASLAQMNANRCYKKHDACHNTDDYRYSGQNLNFLRTTAKTIDDIPGKVKALISSWWDEKDETDARMVQSIYDPGRQIMIFHFAVLAADKSDKIGCAMTQFKQNGDPALYLVCNYGFTDIIGLPMYAQGEPCAGCTKGCSTTYEGLCNEGEPVTRPF